MVNLRPQSGLQVTLAKSWLSAIDGIVSTVGSFQDLSKLMNSDSGTRWGNKFGMLLLPVYYHRGNSDAIQFVKRAKAMIDRKKLSLEAPFSYSVGNLVMSLFGAKVSLID